MNLASAFTMKAFKRATWIAATIAVIFSVVNLFVIGGDSFVIALGDVAPIILSILTFTTVIILWRTFAPGTASRKLWAWFMVGWGLWAIGEILYVVLGYILDEIPYPSLADIAYIVGTIFLIIGLILRLRQNLRELSTTQKLVYWLLALGTVAAVYFLVLQPIVADVAEYGLLMTALNGFLPHQRSDPFPARLASHLRLHRAGRVQHRMVAGGHRLLAHHHC